MFKAIVKGFQKGKAKLVAMSLSALAMISAFAGSAHAENADLTAATTALTDGMGDMKSNGMIVITTAIAIIVVVFGISWLIGIAKRKMNKA
jgi:hypothetical protein